MTANVPARRNGSPGVSVSGPASAPVQSPGDLTQQSVSGTPRGYGWFMGPGIGIQPDDYVSELAEPRRRMQLFEEMRGDSAVNAALTSREKLILSANWALVPADDSPLAHEIAAFVEDNVAPLLDAALLHLAGALQYGFALLEPVFELSDRPFAATVGRGKVRRATQAYGRPMLLLRKLAHIRQRTVLTFLITETGDPTFVRQYVWTGSPGQTIRTIDIPMDRLIRFTVAQEGDDFWGRPPARSIYKDYTIKRQIENLAAMHYDRFGVGVPVIQADPAATQADRAEAQKAATAWRSGNSSALVLPVGWTAQIQAGIAGAGPAMLAHIQHLATSIATTYATQGNLLGSQAVGARSLGDTFADTVDGVAQADCEAIAAVLNEQLIPRLVGPNYGDGAPLPRYVPSQRVSNPGGLIGAIAAGQGVGMPVTAGDLVILRDALELAPMTVDEVQAAMDAKAAQAAQIAQQTADAKAATAEAGGSPASAERNAAAGGDGSAVTPGAPGATPATKPAALSALAAPQPTEGAVLPTERAVLGQTTYRSTALAAYEASVLRPAIVTRDLDAQVDRLAGELADVLRDMRADVTATAKAAAQDGPLRVAAHVRDLAVSPALIRKARAVVLKAAERARGYGDDAFVSELQRAATRDVTDGIGPQRVTPRTTPAGTPDYPLVSDTTLSALAALPKRARRELFSLPDVLRAIVPQWLQDYLDARDAAQAAQTAAEAAKAVQASETPRHLTLVTAADAAVQDEAARIETAARGAIISAVAQTPPDASPETLAAVVERAVDDAVTTLTPGRTLDTARGVINTGFGAGRGDAAERVVAGVGAERFRGQVYSAVMDGGTCPECASHDGAEFPVGWGTEVGQLNAPNARCEGTIKRCRCVWMLVFASEGQLPPSTAPVPVDTP